MEEQVSQLIKENDALKKRVRELEDENLSLWEMLSELKESERSIGTRLQEALIEHIEDEFYKSLKPVGDA
jgi:predicted DNA binding CopG/RHH family protein